VPPFGVVAQPSVVLVQPAQEVLTLECLDRGTGAGDPARDAQGHLLVDDG
jgi:hypothetical protein